MSIRDFAPISKLGEGSYSTVYKVQRLSDNQIYALKKVKMNQLTTKEKENALNEIRILASIESPTIIGYKEAFFDQSINVLCIVMEYADRGDLHNYIEEIKRKKAVIPEQQIWLVIKNILTALETLHSRAIMHRDLKSANIFKTADGYKLGDLNVSKVVAGNLAYTQTGTPYYASPQVWRDEPYDSKSDIWSLGCIVFEMAMLRPPFQGKDMEELFRNVQSKPLPHISNYYSRQLTNFIQLCLQKKASMRPNAKELLNNVNFQKFLKDYQHSEPISEQVVKSQMKQKLLQTIKLPNDLSKLKDKLPNSKYQIDKKNKSVVVDQYTSHGSASQRTASRVEKNINKSEIFKSPSSRINAQQSNRIYRSPVSEVKINPKLSDVVAKYSDRICLSDKKTNKIERGNPKNYEQSYLNIQKYIREEIIRRPPSQNSIPRTQKQSNKDRPTYAQGPPFKSDLQIPVDVEQLRRKLVKKCRVQSSNSHLKPSWWS